MPDKMLLDLSTAACEIPISAIECHCGTVVTILTPRELVSILLTMPPGRDANRGHKDPIATIA
jgi:hypothetical protein